MPKLPDPAKGAKDYEIAEAAEKYMKPIRQIAEELGITDEELLPYGHYVAKVDFMKVLKRLARSPTASTSTSRPSPPPPWARASPPPPWAWWRAWASAART